MSVKHLLVSGRDKMWQGELTFRVQQAEDEGRRGCGEPPDHARDKHHVGRIVVHLKFVKEHFIDPKSIKGVLA